MKKPLLFVAIIFFWFLRISQAETIDVHIKGVDDGIKTTKQQDYKEAVLFAKREAVERAGVMIKSITTVKDLVLNSDYIESQAEAVLLPGYNILDMGYSENGTYQVVLIGKIRTNDEENKEFVVLIHEGFSFPMGMTYEEVFSRVEKESEDVKKIKCKTWLYRVDRKNKQCTLVYSTECKYNGFFPNTKWYFFYFKNNLLNGVNIDYTFDLDTKFFDGSGKFESVTGEILIELFNSIFRRFTVKYGQPVFNNNYDKAWTTPSTHIFLKYDTYLKTVSAKYLFKNH